MSFLTPAAFLFALALPAVLAMYVLRRRRTPRVVSSTVLWTRFLAESRANSPFQRLRRQLLLILQLLLLALAVFALARPRTSGAESRPGLRILVLDASASMQAVDESPNRFEKAREEALALVDSLSGSAMQGVVILSGAATEVRQAATSDRTALRQALRAARVSDAPTRMAEALQVAETLVRGTPDAEVHLFSDGSFGGLEAFATRDLPLVYHRVGRRVRNVGLVRMDVRTDPEDPRRRSVFAAAWNPGEEPLLGMAEVLVDGRVLEERPLEVPATNTVPLTFDLEADGDVVVAVRLRVEDDLSVDNEVRLPSRAPKPLKVRLVTRGNRFLEKAIRSAGSRVDLEVVPELDPKALPAAVTVLDDVLPDRLPEEGGLLAVHVVPPAWFPGGSTNLEAPPVIDWRSTHPLMRFVGLESVQVGKTLSVAPPAWGQVVVESTRTPLVVAGDVGRSRVVWIGFDLLESTWPLRIGFPIFVANALEWLDPEGRRSVSDTVQPGQALRWPVVSDATEARVVRPDGTAETVAIGAGMREVLHAGTERQGIYRIESGTNSALYAVNLMDPAETDVRPAEKIDLGRRGDVAAADPVQGGRELWRIFAACVLAVMLLEWWWFHRRA